MARDDQQFPADENGDVLWQMAKDGDNLAVRREFDFSVIFPTEDAAIQFAVYMLRNDQKVSFSEYPQHKALPWQVQLHPVLLPTHAQITGYENLLAKYSARYGGRNDGWGSFQKD